MPTFIQPSFAKGELAPALYGRVDVAAYQIGVKTARNIIIHSYGGASNRPGLLFCAPSKVHTAAGRLIPFKFKTEDQYVLEFGNLYMRVLRNDAHVLEASVNITGATQANPVVVTAAAHGYSNGAQVYIQNVGGMTQLNGRWFTVANVTANTFQLTDQVTGSNINGTSYGAYTSGGTVAKVYEIATPYALADLPVLKYVQSADVMTLTHASYETRKLSRTGHAAWTLAAATFAPDQDHPTGQTVTVNSAGGVTHRYQVTAINDETGEESLPALNSTTRNITGITQANPAVVTSAAHGFSNGDEVEINSVAGMTELNGRRFTVANVAANTFQLENENSTSYTAYSSGGTANQTFVRVTNSISSPDNTIAWTAVTGAGKYSVYREKNGLFGWIGDTETETFEDDNLAADLDIGPPSARNPFRGAGNYPGTSSYFEQRQVFGGTTNKPDTSYYTQTGNHGNLSVSSPTQADDAITATLNSLEVNEIRHFVPGNDLIILTSGQEWRVNSGADAAFEAATLKQKPQSNWGSSHRKPIVIGNTVLYVTENNVAVRSLGYSLQIDGYTGSDLTTLAHHLLRDSRVKEWAFARIPDPVVAIVREDGKLLLLTFNQEQEVVAWSTVDTAGKFESVAAARPSADDMDEQLYFIVRRSVNGQTVRYIERLHDRRFADEVRDAFFVDSGLSLDSPVTISGVSLASPGVVTATAHGFSNGDQIDIHDIGWEPEVDEFDNETQPDQLNGGRYTVRNAAANTFTLEDEEGDAVDTTEFNTYVEGGTARKVVTSLGGLWHLEGKTVSILGDGNVISGGVVSGGTVTLGRGVSRAHVGLKYVSDLETLQIEAPQGTIQGKNVKISKVTVRFERSRGLFIGTDKEDLVEMKQREDEEWGEPTRLLTGDKEITMPTSTGPVGRILMRQRYPLPLTILAVIPDIEVSD